MRNVIERLLNLLAFLLTSSRPVPAEEIRQRVAGYGDSSDEAFRRMFERDKDLLRSIGIPVEYTDEDGWGIEPGYRIDPRDYRLLDPGLTDEERAALALAGRVVRLGGGPSASDALLKLGGVGPGGGQEPLGADLGSSADRLGDLFAAVSERREIEFQYRDAGRRIAPYGLAHRRGHWYLVGEGASGVRVFRVDRMDDVAVVGEAGGFRRPADFDLRGAIDSHPWEAGSDQTVIARVRFDPHLAWWAARTLHVEAPAEGPLEVELPVANTDAFIGWVLSFGDAAVLLGPPELSRLLVERVEAALT
jgi:proteasome accessory factor B